MFILFEIKHVHRYATYELAFISSQLLLADKIRLIWPDIDSRHGESICFGLCLHSDFHCCSLCPQKQLSVSQMFRVKLENSTYIHHHWLSLSGGASTQWGDEWLYFSYFESFRFFTTSSRYLFVKKKKN